MLRATFVTRAAVHGPRPRTAGGEGGGGKGEATGGEGEGGGSEGDAEGGGGDGAAIGGFLGAPQQFCSSSAILSLRARRFSTFAVVSSEPWQYSNTAIQQKHPKTLY
jgi:hypothetical protein